MASAVENAVLHRASRVTGTRLPGQEPHEAYLQVLAHESLWIDSEHIPAGSAGELTPLVGSGGVDASDGGATYDRGGRIAGREAYVRKVVREATTRGSFGELSSDGLRRAIHPNYARDGVYRPALEVAGGDGGFVRVPDHRWSLDVLSGLVLPGPGHAFSADEVYVVSYFQYVGRVGIPDGVKNASTDDVREGAANKYMRRETFDAWLSDSAGVVLSLNAGAQPATSDDVAEGAVNLYFTQERFEREMASKTLDDVPDGDGRRAMTDANLASLNAPLGAVPSVRFTTVLEAPADRTNALYVERVDDQDRLMFNAEPVGAGGGADSSAGAAASAAAFAEAGVAERTLGNFAGTFGGRTTGLHTGDVVGNVSGLVSSIDNHRIISAKLLGSGEGHWTGTMNGDVVGKFEGHAKVITGSIDNAYHVTVGTYDATALLHIAGGEEHVRLTNSGTGASSLIECGEDGVLRLSAGAVATDSFECATLECFGEFRAADVHAEKLTCVGIHNNFYGMFDVGVIEGATSVVAERVEAAALACSSLDVGGVVRATSLSVSSIVGVVSLGELQETLTAYIDEAVSGLSVGALQNISASHITAGTLSCSELTFDTVRRTIPAYSPDATPAVITSAANASDLSFIDDDCRFEGDVIVEGSLFVTDTIFIGVQPSLNVEGVNSLTASYISVGTLNVGMITGLVGGGSDAGVGLLDDFLDAHDTVHEGSLKVDGNLVVTGLLLTGTTNLVNEIAVDGSISVGGDVHIDDGVDGLSLKDAILDLRQRVSLLEGGA